MMRKGLLGLFLALLMAGCSSTAGIFDVEVEAPGWKQASGEMAAALTGNMPSIEKEFRAAWVATVDNIDWPSEPGLTSL
ncbi:hypothetical protein HQ496_06080, partial [bacterium]|nr:hypothetical protein [bacterium]